ncbi:substrate-binding periplasmic protein [Undibacterium fentianense]|uniref:Transporter substrate-binding domain-containing protein n=1 Tax=Undibacterium fentianense TaxID=2828728 RepID=A0A941IGA0_9BURK|nr:transporter substrate-binding domain-containing protein [Undibacterium fentianense]MBR7799800.1 transporter substrate-binding domain-containing protein [Undibacterium fentianense]
MKKSITYSRLRIVDVPIKRNGARFRASIRHFLVLIWLVCSGSAVQSQEIKAYTEEWPPYNFKQGNTLKGIATDILQFACSQAQLKCDLQLVPWNRAYKTTQDNANALIYTIARIPAREHQFLWIGPILPRTTWVFARTDIAHKIHSIRDLDQFKVGAIRAEASITELREAGVAASAIQLFNSNSDEMRVFKSGKLDVVVNTEIGMAMNQKQFGIASEEYIKLMKLHEGGDLYFAMNLQSNPELVEKLQASVEKLRRDGKIQLVVQQYTK